MGSSDGPKSCLIVLDLLERAPEEIEADLHDVYTIDVLDMWRGKLSPRKVLALILQLPDNSRTKGRMQGKDFVGWGYERYILTGIYDAIRGLQYITANQNAGRRKGAPPKPTPVPQKPVKKENFMATMLRQQLDGKG